MKPQPTMARSVANLILLILMAVTGISLSVSVGGNPTLGLQICGGGLVACLVIFLLGGVMVGASKRAGPEK